VQVFGVLANPPMVMYFFIRTKSIFLRQVGTLSILVLVLLD
jgi:hypothetical protein